MRVTDLINGLTEHLKVYLLAGTLVAIGIDVTTNVSNSMGGAMSASMTSAMPTMIPQGVEWSVPVRASVRAIGALIVVVGAALYVGNMWCGFVALRQFRRFRERGAILQACGWSAAFVYVLTSAVIGVAVNAVYLALVS